MSTYLGTREDRIAYLQNQFRIRRLNPAESQELLTLEDDSRRETAQASRQQQTEADKIVSKLQELRDVQAQRERVAAEAFAETMMHQWRMTEPAREAAIAKATAEVDKWVKANPAYNTIANKYLLIETIMQRQVTVDEAVRLLGGSLSFDADIAAKENAKKTEEHKRGLCLFIAQNHSPQLVDQNQEYEKWLRRSYDEVSAKAEQVRANKRLIAAMKANPTKKASDFQQPTTTMAAQADIERRSEWVAQQQTHYPPLPQTTPDGTPIDSKYLFDLSNRDYPRFKQLVRNHGAGNVTLRIRGIQ